MNILEQANFIVHGERNKAYGHPLDNHGLTADYWNTYLTATGGMGKLLGLTAEDVCMLNILQKIARFQNSPELNRDSLVDIAGYAANIEMINLKRNEEELEGEKDKGEEASSPAQNGIIYSPLNPQSRVHT